MSQWMLGAIEKLYLNQNIYYCGWFSGTQFENKFWTTE